MNLNDALTIINEHRASGKKIGFTCSSFDLLHAGHYMMLEESREKCDFLIVGLQTDPTLDESYRVLTGGKNKNVPVQSYYERYIQITGCKYVDLIVKYATEDDLMNMLTTIKPDIRMVGDDWKGKQFTGYNLDIPIHFNDRMQHSYSTSNLRKRVYEAELSKLSVNV